ncbi:MAG: aminopeptidase P family protein [Bacteroidetes bacterium]|jgi:Xaa-Pro aminopeptidase|nr:aminopeptidase P family protein [Bacteroidota bacterium]
MIKKNNFLLLFCLLLISVSAQDKKTAYDNDMLPASFHADKRQALRDKMDGNSVAIIFANAERNRSNDVDYQYSQDPNFYYLTGLTEPNAVLLIFKERITIDSITCNEILFVQPRNEKAESWTGKRLGTTGAIKELGFRFAYNNFEFDEFPLDFARFATIYHPTNHNDARDDKYDSGDLFSLLKSFEDKTAKLKEKKNASSLFSFMSALREIKSPEELKLLQKAIDITCDAHLDLMKSLDSTMTEYQAQALVEFGFKFNGSEYVGYPSIVGAGENSCILHYITNRKKFENPEMLVVDAGAEYHGYTADVTRTLPVNGKFSKEQAEIYNIVLKAQEEGIKACKKGNNFRDPHNAAVDVIKKKLVDLGIIIDPNDFIKYFFHGTSHYLGLDVHDAGTYSKLKVNSVITVEPGIYIPAGSPCDKKWWNIGIRIEDDVLITDGEPVVMSGKLPKTVAEIEKLMKEEGILKKN